MERHGEKRVRAKARNDVDGRCLGHDGIGGADRGLAVLERIPGEANAGLKILVIRMVGLPRRNQGAGGGIEIGEAARGFRWRGVPTITESDVESEVRPPFEAVLGKDVIGRLQNLVVSRAE